MQRVIWTCWFQGRETAPDIVKACLDSWERSNPEWELRCLDQDTINRYLSIGRHIDLSRQRLTAASLSDVLRILLLHEYGGVWADATLLCNRPLDDWLPDLTDEGFFAFAAPGPDRTLSSWFLAADGGNHLVSAWREETLKYWSGRSASDDYFWFHHLFDDVLRRDAMAAAMWSRVPKVSAEPPHALQRDDRLFRPASESLGVMNSSTPVFKLTHRIPPDRRREPASLLDVVIDRAGVPSEINAVPRVPDDHRPPAPTTFAALAVATENLGDHIQILAGLRLLERAGVEPSVYIDRDNEIHSAPMLDGVPGRVGIVLNGWFKFNGAEWPPHPTLAALLLGFHIRLFQSPQLVSDEAIAFYKRNEPIGCRDPATTQLLASKGVRAFTSGCLSLTFDRRRDDPSTQTEVFVVSRDERIRDRLPRSMGPYVFVSHYSGSTDFDENMSRARSILDIYQSRAKLIVTTLLHCALPALAMGIPVVVLHPMNDVAGHASDVERFSALDGLVPVHSMEDLSNVDWDPLPVDVGPQKLKIIDQFFGLAERWHLDPATIGPISPSSALPAP